jgi:hypothetical protein
MTNYLVTSLRKVFVSMDAARSEESGVLPETKLHPHVVISPLTLGGAEAVSLEDTAQKQTVTLLCVGIARFGGDWSLYPAAVNSVWPDFEDLDGRKAIIRSLLTTDVTRIGEEIGRDMALTADERRSDTGGQAN